VKNKNPNPNHNIWNNNGTYWCHYTVHNDDYTKQRVRVSLGTNDVQIARALRDFLMDATPKIATNIPRMRGQAMPDSAGESRVPASRGPLRRYDAMGV
jgi:spore germination protein GerM